MGEKHPIKIKNQKQNVNWLSSNPIELCDRLRLFMQEREAGNISYTLNEKFIAITEKKRKKNKSLTIKQHRFSAKRQVN